MDNNAEGDRGSGLVRCASLSSLDEFSQERARAVRVSNSTGPGGDADPGSAGHASRLLAELNILRRDRSLCDVVLHARADSGSLTTDIGRSEVKPTEEPTPAEDQETDKGVAAHRAILAASSPYFRAMFTQFDERTQHTITIRNIEPAALEAIVEYIYEPESLRITESNVQALLAGASLLAIGGVRTACGTFLTGCLAPDNVLGIRAFAELHACPNLVAAAQKYLERHFLQVVECEEWISLPSSTVVEVLALDSLRCGSRGEGAVFDAALRWVRASPRREPQLEKVLDKVRLPLLPRDALVAATREPPLLNAPVEVKDMIIEALAFHLVQLSPLTADRVRPRRPPIDPKIILVCGGQAPKAIRDVEALEAVDSETSEIPNGRWTTRASLPSRRCRAGLAARGDGTVLAVGGFNGNMRVRTVDVYHVATDEWTPGPSMIARRSTLGVCVCAGLVYAVGGFDGSAGLASAEVLQDGSWRPLADMSTRRSSVGVAALDGRVYAVGGYDGVSRSCLSSVERYDPATGRWEAVEDMTARRSGAGVAVLGGKLYAVGGHDGPAVRRSVEFWAAGEGWRAAPPMLSARRNAAAAALHGKLYVVGGDDGFNNLDTVEVFDPATQTWTELEARMSLGRSYAAVCVVGGL